MGLRKVPEGPLKDGFTTGTSATAAAKSALMAIIHQKIISSVKVHFLLIKYWRFLYIIASLQKTPQNVP